MVGIARDRYDVNRVWLMRVDGDWEAKIAGQIAADFVPRFARVFGAHHVPVLLHEQDIRTGRVHGDTVDAVSDLGGGIWQFTVRMQPLIDGSPGDTTIITA